MASKEIHSFRTSFRCMPMQSCRWPIERNIELLPSLVEKNSLPIRGKVLSTKEKVKTKKKRNPKIQQEEHKEKRAMQAREKKTSTLR